MITHKRVHHLTGEGVTFTELPPDTGVAGCNICFTVLAEPLTGTEANALGWRLMKGMFAYVVCPNCVPEGRHTSHLSEK